MDERSQWMQADSIACQVAKYFVRHPTFAPRKIPGSGKTYFRLFGERYHSSTREGLSSTSAKAVDQEEIERGAMGRSVIDWNLSCPPGV